MLDKDIFTQAWEVFRYRLDERTDPVPGGLRARCPGRSDAEYAAAERMAKEFNEAAGELLARDWREVYAHLSYFSTQNPAMDRLVEELHTQFPHFPENTCRVVLGWIWYWRFMR